MIYKALVLALFIVAGEAAKSKTECLEHRERELKSKAPLPMRLIPDCDGNGDYKPRQCFKDSDFCACWTKDGLPVTQPSKKVKLCNCLVEKHVADKKVMPGAFTPRCTEQGEYQKVQCHSSTGHCWCAHPETGKKLSEPARGKPKCWNL